MGLEEGGVRGGVTLTALGDIVTFFVDAGRRGGVEGAALEEDMVEEAALDSCVLGGMPRPKFFLARLDSPKKAKGRLRRFVADGG